VFLAPMRSRDQCALEAALYRRTALILNIMFGHSSRPCLGKLVLVASGTGDAGSGDDEAPDGHTYRSAGAVMVGC